jgi:hypothetical protein
MMSACSKHDAACGYAKPFELCKLGAKGRTLLVLFAALKLISLTHVVRAEH